MNLNTNIRIYYQPTTSDGAGGTEADGDPVLTDQVWGNVKPMNAFLSMQFMQLTGTQGYEVWIRTDFRRVPDRSYYLECEGIYTDLRFWIQAVEVHSNKTKLICTGENKVRHE